MSFDQSNKTNKDININFKYECYINRGKNCLKCAEVAKSTIRNGPSVCIVCSYSKVTKVYSKILLMKSSENDFIFLPAFYLIMCLMKAPKNVLKIVTFKTRELVSF